MQGDEVGLLQQLFQGDLLDADLDRALGGQERIIGQHLHAQTDGPIGGDGADIAAADDAEGLAGQLDTHELRLFPLAGMGRFVGLRDLAGQREHHGDGMFGGGDGIAERRVHDHNAMGGSGLLVDVVDADTGTANDLQVGGRLDQLGGSLGGGADSEAVILADDLALFGRGQARLEVHVDAALAEDVDGARAEFVGYEYFRHGSVLPYAACLTSLATVAAAQSSQGSRASMSLASTVAPPQRRRPGGASR